MEHRSPTLQADSFPAEPPGKPKNTVVGRLSLLQWIFPAPGIELRSPGLQVDSLPAEPPGKTNSNCLNVYQEGNKCTHFGKFINEIHSEIK